MTVWWKQRHVPMSSAACKRAGLMDYLLKPQHQTERPNQLRLWI